MFVLCNAVVLTKLQSQLVILARVRTTERMQHRIISSRLASSKHVQITKHKISNLTCTIKTKSTSGLDFFLCVKHVEKYRMLGRNVTFFLSKSELERVPRTGSISDLNNETYFDTQLRNPHNQTITI